MRPTSPVQLSRSLKRDAARNLQERVHARCGEDLSRRFHSITFDAFAKGLVDRFGQALPDRWRPRPDFVIDFTVESRFGDLLNAIPGAAVGLSDAEINSMLKPPAKSRRTRRK
jgi:hypothetical protein